MNRSNSASSSTTHSSSYDGDTTYKRTKTEKTGKMETEEEWRDRMYERAKKEAASSKLNIKFAVYREAQFRNWIVPVPMAALPHVQTREDWDRVPDVTELSPNAMDWIQHVDPEAYADFLKSFNSANE